MYNREFKENFISSKDNADTIPMSFLYKNSVFHKNLHSPYYGIRLCIKFF